MHIVIFFPGQCGTVLLVGLLAIRVLYYVLLSYVRMSDTKHFFSLRSKAFLKIEILKVTFSYTGSKLLSWYGKVVNDSLYDTLVPYIYLAYVHFYLFSNVLTVRYDSRVEYTCAPLL